MAVRIAVRLTPRGGRDRIDGWDRDAEGRAFLKARVSAPPAEGEANAALVILLAKTLGVPKSAITIVAGQTARLKQVEIAGLETDEALSRLAGRSAVRPGQAPAPRT